MTATLRFAFSLALTLPLMAGDWSAPSVATARDGRELVTCRARLAGDYLLVEVTAAEGWRVYAMDNEQRATEALAGKMSLGVEQNTEVQVEGGLELDGAWLQPPPRDYSQPELRWYSYGFAGASLFAVRVRRTGAPTASVTVTAQACDSASCVSVEAQIDLPVAADGGESFRPEGLVPVRGT